MDIAARKQHFRRHARAQLQKLSTQPKRRILDARINTALQAILQRIAPDSILFFYPLKGEPDIRPTLWHYRRQGRSRLFLPFMQDVSFKMVAFRLPLFQKKFGIKEPSFSQTKYHRVEVVVVPIVGTDKSLRRVGYGKGMYDRFFTTLPYKPITIFITRSLLLSPHIITQEHDIQADIIISGDGALIKGKKHDRVDRIQLCRFGSAFWRRDLSRLQKIKQRQLQHSPRKGEG